MDEDREQESGPTGAEATGSPIPPVSTQEAQHTVEVDISDMPQLIFEDATAVTPEEDDMLTGDPTLVAGEMVQLQVTPPESHELEDGEAL